MFKSRYLNGSATFNLFFRDGRLSVTPQTIQVRGGRSLRSICGKSASRTSRLPSPTIRRRRQC